MSSDQRIDAEGGGVVFHAAGGTGGHIFPMVAVAEAIDALVPERPTHVFLSSDRLVDARILESIGAQRRVIPAKPFGVSPRRLIPFVLGWKGAVEASTRAFEDFTGRGPKHLLTTGGFVAPPAVAAATKAGVGVTLLNLDAVPGKASSWVAPRASDALSALEPIGSKTPGRWRTVGPVVRRAAVSTDPPEQCRSALGLEPKRPTLFVSGGSLGASSINEMMVALLHDDADLLLEWQVLHLTGAADRTDDLQSEYDRAGVVARCVDGLAEPSSAWGAATLALCRGGAGTVAEAWANRVPSLVMPYPHHRDEHQRENASALVSAGGAIVESDRVDPALNLEGAGAILAGLIRAPEKIDQMRVSLADLGPADGAARVAELIVERMGIGIRL